MIMELYFYLPWIFNEHWKPQGKQVCVTEVKFSGSLNQIPCLLKQKVLVRKVFLWCDSVELSERYVKLSRIKGALTLHLLFQVEWCPFVKVVRIVILHFAEDLASADWIKEANVRRRNVWLIGLCGSFVNMRRALLFTLKLLLCSFDWVFSLALLLLFAVLQCLLQLIKLDWERSLDHIPLPLIAAAVYFLY